MAARLFALMVAVPIVELTLLIAIGQRIGALPVILFIVITGLVGVLLARMQGVGVLMRIREELRLGHMPAEALVDAVLVLAGSILLITPGVLSDLLGLLLLVPASRSLVKVWLGRTLRRWIEDGSIRLFIR